MKQKHILSVALAIIAIVISVLNDWFNDKPTQPTNEKSVQPVPTKQTPNHKSAVNFDYDFVMQNDVIGQNRTSTDYYMLVLSWSPIFCENQREKFGKRLPESAQMQCGTSKKYGWIIHGLWPQNANAKSVSDHPRFCQGDLPPVDYRILEKYLNESPSPHLLQGEWEKHGACAFKAAQNYFQKQQDLYRTLRLPNEEMARKDLFAWLKQHNPQLKNIFLQASHKELFICYNKDWQVMDCPKNP
ncbi:MAG: ribonuclease [Lonepinella koalarum]|nr:ribonuclease [Lonepinella koalarum]